MAPFDIYTWRARVQPGLLCALPAAATGGILLGLQRDWSSGLIGFGCGEVVLFFVSQVIRDRGKRIEPVLWRSWGGAPTSLILKGAEYDGIVNRNRVLMNELLPGSVVDASEQPSTESIESYVRLLRERTRDRTTFPLVAAENTSYGFRRNCYGIRAMGIGTACLPFLAATGVGGAALASGNRHVAVGAGIALALDVLAALTWTWLVTPEWVKVQGFNYARALLGAAEIVAAPANGSNQP